MGRILSRRLFRNGGELMSKVWRGFTPDTHPVQTFDHELYTLIAEHPRSQPARQDPGSNAGCQRWVPDDRSTRAVLWACATVARSLAHASTDDTAERHTEAQLLRHRPEAGGARRPLKGTQPLAHTDRRRSASGHSPSARGGALGPTKGTQPLAHTDRRCSGHSEAKLGRWPSIQVGGQELRPRAAELVHKGGRVDGELLHDAHKLRVETERQVAREHVKLLTHRLVL